MGNFVWDGLALIKRGTESFINKPAITGGNPVFGTESGVMFNDMLGTTLGIKGENFTKTSLTAFGESLDKDNRAFFTGKPYIGELGYAFLLGNYRADMGKWQTADPLGYPDGWNNLAYVNNDVLSSIDFLGCAEYSANAVTIWQKLCQTQSSNLSSSSALNAVRNGYYKALTSRNPFANASSLFDAANAQAGSINSILGWNPSDINSLPQGWQDTLGSLGYQINSGINNASQVISKIQNVLNAVSSAFDAAGNIKAGQEYKLIGSLLEYGASVAPYGTGDLLNFYATACNDSIEAVINISLFLNNTLAYIDTFCDAIQNGRDYQVEYATLMQRLRNAGFAE